MNNKYAWTTLLTTVDYLPGVLLLNASLKRVASKYPLVIIISDTIAEEVIPDLEAKNCLYYVVPDLQRMYNGEHLFSIDMLMKFYSFELTDYKKVCYLDGDILILKNCDFVFNYRAPAAKYLGWDEIHPIHTSEKKGQLAGEMMILEPGTFSMDYFFNGNNEISNYWDEAILMNYFGIQKVTDIRITDTNYMYHAHTTGNNNRYWERCNIYNEKDLDHFLNEYSINEIRSKYLDKLNIQDILPIQNENIICNDIE